MRKARTLAAKRLNQFGIGHGAAENIRVTRKWQVDYLKLNDGLDDGPEEPTSPKPKRKRNFLPSRSGPSSTRQRAQKIITSPPAHVLPCVTAAKTTLQSSGVHTSSCSGVQPVPSSTPNDVLPTTTTPAVMDSNKLSGAQLPLSGIQTPVKSSLNSFAGVQLPSTCVQPTLSGTETLYMSTLSGVQSSIPGIQNIVMYQMSRLPQT